MEDGRETPAGTGLREKETAPATQAREVEDSEYGSVQRNNESVAARRK